MAKKGTRKAAKGYYLTQRLWSPFGHVISATGNTVGEVTGTVGNIAKRGLKGAKRMGNIWTRHANMAVKDLVKRKGRKANTRRNGRNGRK